MSASLSRISLLFLVVATLAVIGCGGSSGSSNSPTPGVSGVHSAYVANSGAGTISEYAIDDKGGLHGIAGSPLSAGINPTMLAMTSDGNFLYAVDPVKNVIAEFSINSTTGVLTSIGTQNVTATPSSVAMDSKGKFLYVGNNAANNIAVYAVGSDGKLTEAPYSPIAVNGPVQALTVSAKGTYLFASIPSTGSVYEFALDSTGLPPPHAGSPISIGTNPRYVAVSPDETFAIVLDQLGLVNRVNIDASTGALTLAAFSPFTANAGPAKAIIDSTNTYVFIMSDLNKAVTTISFQSSGAPFQVSVTATGNGPSAMAPSGSFFYIVNRDDNTVSEFSLSAGAATTLSPATVETGTTPLAIAVR